MGVPVRPIPVREEGSFNKINLNAGIRLESS